MSREDAKAIRSSTYFSEGERFEDRESGPAGALGLDPFAALHLHISRLRSALEGVACERAEIGVLAYARRLDVGPAHLRVAATVRLVVHGPRTISPILWQAGGVEADVEAWVADLAATLPRELEAVHTGEGLAEPWTGTVVLDPWVASLLVHECIGHTSEADNYLDYVVPAGLALGHRWTDAALTVVDDPSELGRIGSYTSDDEGQDARPTTLVAEGVWRELLHSRHTAAILGAERSGNGRRVVGAAASIPRMSVLTTLPGEHSLERLIAGVEDGYYCGGSWGAGSFGRRFVLRPTHARRIREGKIEDSYLRRFELRGDKFETIAAIDAVGDDTRRFDPAFGCDKNGQDDLPVSFGAPHLRLRGITLVPLRSSR